MCKRTTTDPLVRLFLDGYHLNLLLVPRAGALVGDLYVQMGAQVSSPGHVSHLVGPNFVLPPLIKGERLTDLAGTASRGVDLKSGLGLLSNFWAAMTGSPAPAVDLQARFAGRQATNIRFRIEDPRRDHVDPLQLGKALIGCRLAHRHPLVQQDNRYFLTTAVVYSNSLSIQAEDGSGRVVDVGVDAVKTLAANTSLQVDSARGAELTFHGKTALVLAVELYELVFHAATQQFTLHIPEDYVATRDGAALPPALVGRADGDAFVQLV